MDPTGKHAVVVGGVSGIGLACVHELIKNGIKKLVVIDYNPTLFHLESEYMTEASVICLKADVSIADEIKDAFKKAKDWLLTIDIVLNNVGIRGEHIWEKMIDVNLKGQIRGTLLALDHMALDKGGQGGVIINTASIAGLVPVGLFPIYTSTKFGIVGFTASVGTESNLKLTGVRVMTMCPGLTETEIISGRNKYIQENPPDNEDEEKYFAFVNEERNENKSQMPSSVALGMMFMIRNGTTGSVWLTEESKTYELKMPNINEHFQKKRVI